MDLFQAKDYGQFLMVRAANMKITVDKKARTIVNISGGGCPDVPYLAREMVGKTLEQAPQPRRFWGIPLCGYALQLAYEEMLRRCRDSLKDHARACLFKMRQDQKSQPNVRRPWKEPDAAQTL